MMSSLLEDWLSREIKRKEEILNEGSSRRHLEVLLLGVAALPPLAELNALMRNLTLRNCFKFLVNLEFEGF